MQPFEDVAEAIDAAMRFFQESGELMVVCVVLFAGLQQLLGSRGGWLSASAIAVCFPLIRSTQCCFCASTRAWTNREVFLNS